MLEVSREGSVMKIDVRERIRRGDHPKNDILDYVRRAERGTVIEIHLPFAAKPLVAALEAIGVNAILNEIGSEHYRLMCVKL